MISEAKNILGAYPDVSVICAIASIVLWNTVDLGYLTVHAASALRSGALKNGVREISAGRLGTIQVDGDQVMLGKPFRFTKQNIDQFDF